VIALIFRSKEVSKEKKSRKARTPNVPTYTGPVIAEGTAGGGDTLTARNAKATAPTATRAPARTEGIQADYTHIVSDLRRIGLLAGGLLVVLVILSFIIK
jgi:hypothetical protein